MPYIIQGQKNTQTDFQYTNFEYKYPNGLNLKPGSDTHKKLKDKVLEYARISQDYMSARYPSWNRMDELMTVYVEESDADAITKDKADSKTERRPTSIIFPYSYAMAETLVTYLFVAFGQDPIFRYEGYSPEDTIGAMLMELVIQHNCLRSKVLLPLHTMFRDAVQYGMSIGAPSYAREMGKRYVKRPVSESPMGKRYDRAVEDYMAYEGNVLDNISPYLYLPDPAVPVHKVQDGEFVGWVSKENYINLLMEEQQDEDLFNIKYLQKVTNKRSAYGVDQSARHKKAGTQSEPRMGDDKNLLDVIYMHMKLIPKEFGIGDSEVPEKWLVAVAGDEVIIKAFKLEHLHGKFPVVTMAPDFDGYSAAPLSRMEILDGLQDYLDFLFNSHMANVRKAVNDMIIVDPMMVNMEDMKDPKPGKLIRLRRPAWGRGVKDVAQQLAITDVTKGNLGDSAYIVEWMQRVFGVDEGTMGSLRQGGPERLTKSEFQGTRQGTVSRLERIARVIGLQGMQDLGYFFACHTQEYMTEDTYVKIVGRWKEDLQKEFGAVGKLTVSPMDLLVQYDVVVRDGSVPGGNFSEAWLQLFNIIMGSEVMVQQFDVFRIFSHIARSLGAKNVEDFKRQQPLPTPTVMPDQQVAAQAQAGNIVPMPGV